MSTRKLTATMVALMALAAVSVACSSSNNNSTATTTATAAATATGTAMATETGTAMATETATAMATETATPMATETATPMADNATTVNVTMKEFSITSSVTDFKVGQPYHFVVKNEGVAAHELMVVKPIDPGSMTAAEMEAAALAMVQQSDLPSGGTAEFDLTFDQTYSKGSLELACHLPGHYEAGMHTSITVSQ